VLWDLGAGSSRIATRAVPLPTHLTVRRGGCGVVALDARLRVGRPGAYISICIYTCTLIFINIYIYILYIYLYNKNIRIHSILSIHENKKAPKTNRK